MAQHTAGPGAGTVGVSQSENFSKTRKPGRSRVFGEEYELLMRGFGSFQYPNRRGNINEEYRMRAYRTLWIEHPDGQAAGQAAYAWLGNPDKPDRESRPKKTILGGLGRIEDPETIRAVALRLCELQPLTVEAVQMVRSWRVGKSVPASTGALMKWISRALDEYRVAHPETTYAMMLEALRKTADVVGGAAVR